MPPPLSSTCSQDTPISAPPLTGDPGPGGDSRQSLAWEPGKRETGVLCHSLARWLCKGSFSPGPGLPSGQKEWPGKMSTMALSPQPFLSLLTWQCHEAPGLLKHETQHRHQQPGSTVTPAPGQAWPSSRGQDCRKLWGGQHQEPRHPLLPGKPAAAVGRGGPEHTLQRWVLPAAWEVGTRGRCPWGKVPGEAPRPGLEEGTPTTSGQCLCWPGSRKGGITKQRTVSPLGERHTK